MEQVTPEIKLTIENALLHNNKQLTDEFDKSIEKHMEVMTRTINQQTQPLMAELVEVARQQESIKARIGVVENEQKLRKARMAAYGAAGLIALGVFQFLLTQVMS